MDDLTCPLLQKLCIRDECAWYAGGIEKCVIPTLGIMLEQINNMGVQTFQTFVEHHPGNTE